MEKTDTIICLKKKKQTKRISKKYQKKYQKNYREAEKIIRYTDEINNKLFCRL